MPIVLDGSNGTFVLVCLNQHRTPEGGTTMLAVEDWLSVPTGAAPGQTRINLGGVLLRCYYCSVCGYVEMYMPKKAAAGATGA